MVDRPDQSDDAETAGSNEGPRATGERSGGEEGERVEESDGREGEGEGEGEDRKAKSREGEGEGEGEDRKAKSREGDGGQHGSEPRSPSDEQFDEELPKYLREGLAKQDVGTLRVARRYVDALIDRKRRPVSPEELPENASTVSETADGYIVEEYVRCGKDNCACTSGAESDMHGPYEYRYYRDDDGSLHKEYADNE